MTSHKVHDPSSTASVHPYDHSPTAAQGIGNGEVSPSDGGGGGVEISIRINLMNDLPSVFPFPDGPRHDTPTFCNDRGSTKRVLGDPRSSRAHRVYIIRTGDA